MYNKSEINETDIQSGATLIGLVLDLILKIFVEKKLVYFAELCTIFVDLNSLVLQKTFGNY